MATFTWTPSTPAQVLSEPRIIASSMQEFEQRRVAGINTDLKRWKLTFENRTDSETASIMAFLAAARGADSFEWTSPFGDSLTCICRSWDMRIVGLNSNTISCQFDEVVL